MSRNTGIFWCMFQCSLIIGTLYIYFAWEGVEYVDNTMKNLLFTGLSVLGKSRLKFKRDFTKTEMKNSED